MRARCKGGDPACLSLSHSHKLHKSPSHSHVPQSATSRQHAVDAVDKGCGGCECGGSRLSHPCGPGRPLTSTSTTSASRTAANKHHPISSAPLPSAFSVPYPHGGKHPEPPISSLFARGPRVSVPRAPCSRPGEGRGGKELPRRLGPVTCLVIAEERSRGWEGDPSPSPPSSLMWGPHPSAALRCHGGGGRGAAAQGSS